MYAATNRDHTQLIGALALLGAAGPSLLAYNPPPSPTFLNQALALGLWGGFVLVAGGRQRFAPARSPFAALGLLGGGVLWSWGPGALPSSLALSALSLLAATAVLLASGTAARAAPRGGDLFAAFCIAWVAAGSVNAGIAMLQVFAPNLADGDWIARSGLPGRAVGNLRQPNHLSSLLLWASIALVPLLEARRLRWRSAAALSALMMFAVVLTASRTGLVSVLLLAVWGFLDHKLSRPARLLLLCAPVVYALAFAGMWLWAHAGAHAFGGEARLAASDVSSSRFGIWANTLALIRQHLWTGVGFGDFNFAWSLTPFPGRPTAFFDHTHNLPLQLLVELGLPLGGTVLILLVWALWRAVRQAFGPEGDVNARCAVVFVLMIGVHSLLEYPLWYAYFLLPTAWAWGYALGTPRSAASGAVRAGTYDGRWLTGAGAALVLGAAVSVWDYSRVVRIFEAAPGAAPLAQRVVEGRRSIFFSHHADYAAATTGLPQPDGLAVFDGAAHYLLDTRLMVAWAEALDRAGKTDAARTVAARLREFGPERAPAFFAGCADPASAAASFACQAPEHPLNWQDFVHP